MKNIKCIMFDCMETIIDMTELPSKSDYALWAFKDSECEKYFKTFDEFYDFYKKADRSILSSIPQYREYDFEDIYKYIMKEKQFDEIKGKALIKSLLQNYWDNYRGRCYVDDEVRETLKYLSVKYNLGIVSNFKIKGGIEDLLKYTGVRKYFHFVINSAEEGWRKPHPNIYISAINISRFSCDDTLFVGDDFINDYVGPRKAGLVSMLLDKKKDAVINCKKINKFVELKGIL